MFPNDAMTFACQSQLGWNLVVQKKYAEAEPILLAGYEGLKARAEASPAVLKQDLTASVRRLAQVYSRWGKPEQASKWEKQLKELEAMPPIKKNK